MRAQSCTIRSSRFLRIVASSSSDTIGWRDVMARSTAAMGPIPGTPEWSHFDLGGESSADALKDAEGYQATYMLLERVR